MNDNTVKNNNVVLAAPKTNCAVEKICRRLVYLFVRKTKGLDLKHNQVAFYESEKIFVFCFTSYHRKLNIFTFSAKSTSSNSLSEQDWCLEIQLLLYAC